MDFVTETNVFKNDFYMTKEKIITNNYHMIGTKMYKIMLYYISRFNANSWHGIAFGPHLITPSIKAQTENWHIFEGRF